MKIKLNGKTITTKSKTLTDLIQEQGFDTNSLIAEINSEVIRQETWSVLKLKDGDTIELLSFVGGG